MYTKHVSLASYDASLEAVKCVVDREPGELLKVVRAKVGAAPKVDFVHHTLDHEESHDTMHDRLRDPAPKLRNIRSIRDLILAIQWLAGRISADTRKYHSHLLS